jgi:hypothetical protein
MNVAIHTKLIHFSPMNSYENTHLVRPPCMYLAKAKGNDAGIIFAILDKGPFYSK